LFYDTASGRWSDRLKNLAATDAARPNRPVNEPTPILEYADPRKSKGNRFGNISCNHAIVGWTVAIFNVLVIMSVRPMNNLAFIVMWPVTLIVAGFGCWYAMRGLRHDPRRTAAIIGLIFNLVVFAAASTATLEALRMVGHAYRHHQGIIESETR
jgi:hypothetical protein